MDIRKGSACCSIQKEKKKGIAEVLIGDYTVYVFPGGLSKFDILVRYQKDGGRLRTIKHIHWAVDLLMKMQGDEKLTKEYLQSIRDRWSSSIPLTSNDYDALKTLLEDGERAVEIEKYVGLNAYGEYSIDFLYVVMQLLIVQEKTNRSDAYFFGKVLDQLLDGKRDIFRIVSTASYGGRRAK